MKTKLHILNIITENGATRPSELATTLKISPQALHRHLRTLVSEGTLEPIGRPPFTRYVVAGTPDFSKALLWFQSNRPPNSAAEVCESRDIFSARLSQFIPLERQGLLKEDLPLVISLAGEIGNNSFDHNLGQWKDVPGSWFEIQVTRHRLWILIADRGQGIRRSLSAVAPDIPTDQVAVERAFNEQISGRAPEKRGNGLKFVRTVVTEKSGRGLACLSGQGRVEFGDFGKDCLKVFQTIVRKDVGTITLTAWELHHENRS